MKKLATNELLEHCLKHKKALTPSRMLIIKTLSKHLKPQSAYDLLEEINKKENINLNISTIYRVLEFWINLSLIHKLSSINKYITCSSPYESHNHVLNFCTVCENVIETCSNKMGLNLKKSTEKLNLNLQSKQPIEIPVICSRCS